MNPEKLLHLRRQRKITQKEMAERLKVSSSKVSQWESGKAELPLDMVIPISRILRVSAEEILRDDIDMTEEEKSILRRDFLMTLHRDGTDSVLLLIKENLRKYPQDDSLKLMAATVLFMGSISDEDENKRWEFALELLNDIHTTDTDFIRSTVYTKAMILNLMGRFDECEKELDQISWTMIDPIPLYSKVYQAQGDKRKQRKLAAKRVHHHLTHASVMMSELADCSEKKEDILKVQAQFESMFGIEEGKAYLKLAKNAMKENEEEAAKKYLIEYLNELSRIKDNSVNDLIFGCLQRRMSKEEEKILIQRQLEILKKDKVLSKLMHEETIIEIAEKVNQK